MSLRANWSYPTAIKFGAGRIAELAEQCKAVGMTRPLLVTDKALATLPKELIADWIERGIVIPMEYDEAYSSKGKAKFLLSSFISSTGAFLFLLLIKNTRNSLPVTNE